MSRYEKISSGSGTHGVNYEINLLSYYLLKAFQSKENFRLSNGQKDKLKLDDIILESDSLRIFAQAKHIDNEKKKISKSQLFAKTGKYSLYVYLKVAYEDIFQKYLTEIQEELEEILVNSNVDGHYSEKFIAEVSLLSKDVSEELFNYSTKDFKNCILKLRKLNNKRINAVLSSAHNTNFHLVTNISPNKELIDFSTKNSTLFKPIRNFEEIEEYYNFNSNKSINELSELIEENSKIPKGFIPNFLERFKLIVISDQAVKENIMNLLKISCRHLYSSQETYKDIFALVEEWQSRKTGVYLTRNDVTDDFFASIISRKCKQRLKSYEGMCDFTIEPLLEAINHNFITKIKTSSHLPIMTILQKRFEELKIKETLFVDPAADYEEQLLLVKAFLLPKYTHFICFLQNNADELTYLLSDVIQRIEQHDTYSNYKRIILLHEGSVEIGNERNEIVIEGRLLFEERVLNTKKLQYSSFVLENYIPRELSQGDLRISEYDFINYVIKNNDYVIISDTAGMGKSTLLKSLSKKINKEKYYWPIIIQLGRFTELFETHLESETVPLLGEFLNILIENPFERQLCEIFKILIVMVDGFDEISPDYTNIVIEFLSNNRLMNNVKSTVVTTRSHLRDHLENKLGLTSYGVEPLSDENICSLMCAFGKQNLNVIHKWYDSIPMNVREIFLIPLHVKIFADSPQLEKDLQTGNFSANLYELYDNFLNEKKEIFIKEKCNCNGNIHIKKILNEKFKNLLEIYMEIAVEMTFRKEVLNKLGVKETVTGSFSYDLCANGIVEFSKTIRFVHETFKEFLVAKWLVRKLFVMSNPSDENLITLLEIVYMNSFRGKQFIEAYLEKYWDVIPDECFLAFSNIASNHKIFSDILYVNFDYPHMVKLMIYKCESQVLVDRLYSDLLNLGTELIQTDLLLLLIKKGANTNCKTSRGKTLLHIAVQKRDIKLVKYLIDNNFCKIDEKDGNGITSLVLALLRNYIEISEYLIESGADINELGNYLKIFFNNYYRLTRSENLDITDNIQRRYHFTYIEVNCLHIAAFRGNLELAKYVLSKEVCKVNDVTSHGNNVLHCAVQSKNLDMIKYLVSLNADINKTTYRGETVLHLAVLFNSIDLVKYFVEQNIKIESVTCYGETALTIACIYEHIDIINYLLEKYLTLNISDTTPIFDATLLLLKSNKANTLFKAVFEKYLNDFSKDFKSSLLSEAIRCGNDDLSNYISAKNKS